MLCEQHAAPGKRRQRDDVADLTEIDYSGDAQKLEDQYIGQGRNQNLAEVAQSAAAKGGQIG